MNLELLLLQLVIAVGRKVHAKGIFSGIQIKRNCSYVLIGKIGIDFEQ